MAFVPIVPHEEPPSPRARDLGNRLAEVIETFQRQYPGTSPKDIRQAMRLATPGGGDLQKRKAVVAGVLAMLMAGLVVALATGGEETVKRGLPPSGIIAVSIGVLVVVLVSRLRR
jgi:hypothetical protein